MSNLPPAPIISIAIPVHNGGTEFKRCLDCLKRQTLQNFRAIIFENSSSDGTLETALQLAASDPRFEVRPSSSLLPVLENFDRAIAESANLATYFCLRAADDYTSANFLKVLVAALESDASRHLAVGRVVRVNADGTEIEGKQSRVKRVLDRRSMKNWSEKFPASWYYGVYRAGAATRYLLESRSLFPYVWGFDRLVIYKMLSDFGVAYREESIFYCQTGSAGGAKYMARTVSEALQRRVSYYRACMLMTSHQNGSGILFALTSRWTAWRVAGHHTGTRLEQVLKLPGESTVTT